MKKVRLISPEGKQIGIVSREEALRKAEEAGLDLVEVAPQANPPVCRILDYGKFKYQQEKKKKKKHTPSLKEIRMTSKIEEHDFKVKLKNAIRFLEEGHKVKIRVYFRGREIIYKERGREILERVVKEVGEVGRAEAPPRLMGKNMEIYLVPNKEGR